jgi:Flp pilus assembly protein TadG
MTKRSTDFRKSQAGNTGIMFALTALPLLLGAGAAVDMVRANQAQVMLQAAVDAAALSAAATDHAVLDSGQIAKGFYKKTASQIAEEYVLANEVSKLVDISGGVQTKVNAAKSTLTVRIKGKMNTSLMKLAGISTLDIEAVAEVGLSSQALEVVLVLDNTGSMKGAKLADLKSAAHGLVNTLHSKNDGKSYLKIGVVPYSEYVNVGLTPDSSGGWLDNEIVPAGTKWEGCIGSRTGSEQDSVEIKGNKYPPVGNVNCVTELLPLTADRDAVDAKIGSLTAEGYTYIPSGLLWGWHVLTEDAPYKEGMDQKKLEKLGGSKALVLMTDGANTISANGALHIDLTSGDANAQTAKLCNNVKASDIKVFTVAFQVDNDEIKNLLKACATAPEMAFDAGSSEELGAAFAQIGGKLADLYLTK